MGIHYGADIMAITLQLTATSDIEIVSSGDIIFDGASVEFYKGSATHRIKFTGWTKGTPGAASGWVSAKIDSTNMKIFLAGSDNRIPLYWDTTNGNVKVWALGASYTTGSPGSLVIGTDNNVWECTVAHTGAAQLKPTTGVYYGYYWTQNNAADDGHKCVIINNFS